MEIRVTPSARAELFETVVRLRRRNRAEARRFVDEVAAQLVRAVRDTDAAPELDSPWRSATASGGHRLYLRDRTDGVWLIAILPEEARPPTRPVTS
jgi:hypothetical protein